jgi:hypothetical protein
VGYAASESSFSTLSRADSGDASSVNGVTELVKYSVNFRGELEQLLAMLQAAERDTAHSVSVIERQIEEAAKVSLISERRPVVP